MSVCTNSVVVVVLYRKTKIYDNLVDDNAIFNHLIYPSHSLCWTVNDQIDRQAQLI